jgi:hypothetical protein
MKTYRGRFINFMLVEFRGLQNGYVELTERQKALLEELIDDIKQFNSLPKVNEVHKELVMLFVIFWM